MYPVTNEFQEKIKRKFDRRVFGRVIIDYTSGEMDQSVEVSTSGNANISYPNQVTDGISSISAKFASLDGSWKLGDGYRLAPTDGKSQMGWWSDALSNSDGSISVWIAVNFQPRPIHSLKLSGDDKRGEYPVDFDIILKNEKGETLFIDTIRDNNKVHWVKQLDDAVTQVVSIEYKIKRWSHPYRQAKISELFTSIQEIYEDKDLISIDLLEEVGITGGTIYEGSISSNEIRVRLNNIDGKFHEGNKQSPLYQLLKPDRRIRAELGVGVADQSKINIVRDLSGHDNNGKLINSNHDENSGWVDDGLKFNNENEYVELPNLELDIDNFTYQVNDRLISFRKDSDVVVNDDIIEFYVRNLYTNSLLERDFAKWGYGDVFIKDGYVRVESSGAGTNYGFQQTSIDQNMEYKRNVNYTLSFLARGNINRFDYCYLMRKESGNKGMPRFDIQLNDVWQRVEITANTGDWNSENGYVLIGSRDVGEGKYFEVKDIKVNVGSEFDNWTPNPADITKANKIDCNMPLVENNTIAEYKLYSRSLTNEELTSSFYPLENLIVYYNMKPILKKEFVPLGVFWSKRWKSDSKKIYAEVVGRDMLDKLMETDFKMASPLKNISLYDLALIVLKDADISDKYFWIDDELKDYVIPYVYLEDKSHREVLRMITEACLGRTYCDRQGVIRVEGSINATAQYEVEVSERINVSNEHQIVDGIQEASMKTASLDGSWKLDGSYKLAGLDEKYQLGWWGNQLSNSQGLFSSHYPKATISFLSKAISQLLIAGDDKREEYPVDYNIHIYNSDEDLIITKEVRDNNQVVSQVKVPENPTDVTKVELEILKWSHPNRQAKIIEFVDIPFELDITKADYFKKQNPAKEKNFANYIQVIASPLDENGEELEEIMVITKNDESIEIDRQYTIIFPKNYFIQTAEAAQDIADRLLEKYSNPAIIRELKLDWRGNPALELNDIISVLEYDEVNKYKVVRNDIKYTGGLKASLQGRRLT